jgi:hypothetical protein
MGRSHNEVSCYPFDIADFEAVVCKASHGFADDPPTEQVAYLGRYAARLGARSFVVERHYIDRHFTEEFGLYYARCLTPPPSVCSRIHFFSRQLSNAEFDELLVSAVQSVEQKQKLEEALSEAYLGFVVIRPLPHVPVGRTILRPLDDNPEREIFVTTRNTVHLLGLELKLTGLAFQQQDRAVGACATAALWMAMSRAARLEGGRAPTPAFIAEAASRHTVEQGRALPSRGLTIGQVTDAIRACGFAPEVLRATGNQPEFFLAMLFCYLRSGIPVVLILGGEGVDEAHAVTAVGYRVGPARSEFETLLPTRSMRIEQLYVHDDRLGPYARAKLNIWALPAEEEREAPPSAGLFLEIGRDEGADKQEGPLLVRCAIVPVYPKLRISSEDVWPMATHLMEFIQQCAGVRSQCEMFFVRAGSYLEEFTKLASEHAIHLPKGRLAHFIKSLALSRWVCIIRWWSEEDRPLADFLYDTTDVVRIPGQVHSHLLGMVAYEEGLRPSLDVYGKDWSVPVL